MQERGVVCLWVSGAWHLQTAPEDFDGSAALLSVSRG